jgi:hypothetical protein
MVALDKGSIPCSPSYIKCNIPTNIDHPARIKSVNSILPNPRCIPSHSPENRLTLYTIDENEFLAA